MKIELIRNKVKRCTILFAIAALSSCAPEKAESEPIKDPDGQLTVLPQVYADPPKSIMIDGEEFDLDTSVDYTKFGKWYYVGTINMSSGESWDLFYDPSTQNYAIGCLDGPDGFVLGKPCPPLA